MWTTFRCPKVFFMQADWHGIKGILLLLTVFLEQIPSFTPAAIKANFSRHFVRILRNARLYGKSSPESLASMCKVVGIALSCLMGLMRYDVKNAKEMWKPAVDAGIVPVLLDLLTLRHGQTLGSTLELSGMLLMSAPRGEAEQWGVELVRATAGLLNAARPVALHDAAKVLHTVGKKHPALIADCHTWGIEVSLQQLTLHSNSDTAAAARQLKKLLSDVKQQPDVSPARADTLVPFAIYAYRISRYCRAWAVPDMSPMSVPLYLHQRAFGGPTQIPNRLNPEQSTLHQYKLDAVVLFYIHFMPALHACLTCP